MHLRDWCQAPCPPPDGNTGFHLAPPPAGWLPLLLGVPPGSSASQSPLASARALFMSPGFSSNGSLTAPTCSGSSGPACPPSGPSAAASPSWLRGWPAVPRKSCAGNCTRHVPLPNTLLGPDELQVMRGPVLVAPGSRLGQLGNTVRAIQLCLKGASLWPELTHVLQGAHLLRSFIIPQHAPTTFML